MEKVTGIITANYSSEALGALTKERPAASLPFGGRYRLVDFPLSNMVNAGIETVITTLGSRGFEIATQGGKKAYPCIKITPVDTTAAGDTACGGLCAKLSMGESLESAMKYGSLAASIACTRQGAQMSIPTKEEVENYK